MESSILPFNPFKDEQQRDLEELVNLLDPNDALDFLSGLSIAPQRPSSPVFGVSIPALQDASSACEGSVPCDKRSITQLGQIEIKVSPLTQLEEIGSTIIRIEDVDIEHIFRTLEAVVKMPEFIDGAFSNKVDSALSAIVRILVVFFASLNVKEYCLGDIKKLMAHISEEVCREELNNFIIQTFAASCHLDEESFSVASVEYFSLEYAQFIVRWADVTQEQKKCLYTELVDAWLASEDLDLCRLLVVCLVYYHCSEAVDEKTISKYKKSLINICRKIGKKELSVVFMRAANEAHRSDGSINYNDYKQLLYVVGLAYKAKTLEAFEEELSHLKSINSDNIVKYVKHYFFSQEEPVKTVREKILNVKLDYRPIYRRPHRKVPYLSKQSTVQIAGIQTRFTDAKTNDDFSSAFSK